MRRARHALAGIATLVLLAAVPGCGSDAPDEPVVLFVTYRVSAGGNALLDSVKYDNGAGVLQKVGNPPLNWSVVVTVPSGGSVEAQLWGHAQAADVITFKAQWVRNGYSTDADSSTFHAVTASPFSLAVPKRKI